MDDMIKEVKVEKMYYGYMIFYVPDRPMPPGYCGMSSEWFRAITGIVNYDINNDTIDFQRTGIMAMEMGVLQKDLEDYLTKRVRRDVVKDGI